jgi:hypothetical protein
MEILRLAFEDYRDRCFIVRDSGGQALAYVYYEEDRAGERSPSS